MAKMILTNGYYAAEKGSWNWLTDGSNKFYNNKIISFWFADLPALTNGYWMFYYCRNLTLFSSDLSSLTTGAFMFNECSNLTSFEGDLPNLTEGYQMFYYCTNLTSFTSDLSSLTEGTEMFGGSTSSCTKLDLVSVQNIANTINTVSSGTIHIGMQKSLQSDDETAPINVALAAIRAKGWTVNEIYA